MPRDEMKSGRVRAIPRLESPVSSAQSANAPARAAGDGDREVIERFMLSWAPFATLPLGSRARTSIVRFLAANDAEARARALEYANALFRLRRIYAALGALRTDLAFDPYSAALELTPQAVATAVRQGGAQEILALLQQAFEFGRHPAPPQQQAARTFLLEFWALHVGGTGMKYCIFPNGIPYSGAGKTHEETARQFVALGFGNGLPQCGGSIERTGDLAFQFDIASTAFRSSAKPDGVRQAILRWVRATGADETKVTIHHRGKEGGD